MRDCCRNMSAGGPPRRAVIGAHSGRTHTGTGAAKGSPARRSVPVRASTANTVTDPDFWFAANSQR